MFTIARNKDNSDWSMIPSYDHLLTTSVFYCYVNTLWVTPLYHSYIGYCPLSEV